MFFSRLHACKYSFTRNLSSAYQTSWRKNGIQYRSRCNIFNSFGNALLFRYIYKGRLEKISVNIAFLFCKEIYMKYVILYYKIKYYKCYQTWDTDVKSQQILTSLKDTNIIFHIFSSRQHIQIPTGCQSMRYNKTKLISGRHGRERMVVGFITTCCIYAISAYHH